MIDEMSDKQGRLWATLCHLSIYVGYVFLMGHVIAPLVIWLCTRDKYPLVDDQGKEALNFQINMTIYLVIASLLCLAFVGFPILIGLVVWDFIAVIIASVAANHGELYRYPLTMRFIH